MARMKAEEFETLCKAHDWIRLCAEARRARAAEEHLWKAVSAQGRAACEEAERYTETIAQKEEEIAQLVTERDEAISRLGALTPC